MLIVAIWDETLETVPSDTFVEKYVSEFIDKCKKSGGRVEIKICSSSEVDELRLSVLRKKIKPEQLVFQYKGLDIEVTEKGKLALYPNGFSDLIDRQLNELAGWKEKQ